MSKGEFIKAVFGLFTSLVIALVLFTVSALALNPDDCAEWIGPEWNCLGRVEVSDMGTIMPDGSFNWDGPEGAGITSWDPNIAQYHPFGQFYEEYYQEVNAHFPYNVLPDANTVQTIRYTMASGVVVEHQFNITDTSPMPKKLV